MIKKKEDIEIIESIIKGNSEDYRLLVDRYKDRAFSMLNRMLKNEFEAEEVLQDSFLKAYNGLKSFKKEAKFSTWFYKIVYNTCVSVLNSKTKRNEKDFISIDESFEIGIIDHQFDFESIDKSQIIYKYLDLLPIRSSLVLILFYIDGLKINEISDVLNLSVSNVKIILHRARNELKEIMIKNNFAKEPA